MKTGTDLNTESGARALLTACQEDFKTIVERDGYLWPVSVVIARKNPSNGMVFPTPVAIPTQPESLDDKAKEAYFHNVRKFAASLDSPGVIFACSAVDRGPDGAAKTVSDILMSPTIKIYTVLEHVTVIEIWEASVKIDLTGQHTVGPFQKVGQDRGLSTAARLLPPQAWLN